MSIATIRAAAAFFHVHESDVVGPCREAAVLKARYAVIHVMRHRDELSLPIIGKRLGRDHTTVLHAVKRATVMVAEDPRFAAFVTAQMALPRHSPSAAKTPKPRKRAPGRKARPPFVPAPPPEPIQKFTPPPKWKPVYETVHFAADRTMRIDQDGYTRDERLAHERLAVGSRNLAQAIRQARAA